MTYSPPMFLIRWQAESNCSLIHRKRVLRFNTLWNSLQYRLLLTLRQTAVHTKRALPPSLKAKPFILLILLLVLNLSLYCDNRTHMESFMENRSDEHLLYGMHPHIRWSKLLFYPVSVFLFYNTGLFPKQ